MFVCSFDLQIDDAITYKVAGGLTLEHPLISPFIDSVVSSLHTKKLVFDLQLFDLFCFSISLR